MNEDRRLWWLSFLQKLNLEDKPNRYLPRKKPFTGMLKNGIYLQTEIQYAYRYPNSYLDIYTCRTNKRKGKTLIFVHGGGYAWGDKRHKAPKFKSKFRKNNIRIYLQRLALTGYDVVSINYGLTPDVRYPVPLYQISEAIEFLTIYGANYSIDVSEFILMGNSAGGQLVGQFANVQTNPEYARRLGLEPVVGKDRIKAIVFNSALLDPRRFDSTDNSLVNMIFGLMGKVYFKTDCIRQSILAEEASVLKHIVSDFPPAYLTDGNTMTFTDQCVDMACKLRQLQVPYRLQLYSRNEKWLAHSYESYLGFDKARENFRHMIDFFDEIGF